MPSVYQLKPMFQQLLRPVVAGLARAGITANMVTVAAMVLSIVVGGGIAVWNQSRWPLLALPLFLFVRMALNAIDGMLARDHRQQSRLGALLNELGDVVSDIALYLPLAFTPWIRPEIVVAIVLLAVVSEMAGVLGVMVAASRRYDGPMGKSDRALVFGAVGLWLGAGGAAGIWLDVVLVAVAVLLVVTVVNRSRQALAEAGRPRV